MLQPRDRDLSSRRDNASFQGFESSGNVEQALDLSGYNNSISEGNVQQLQAFEDGNSIGANEDIMDECLSNASRSSRPDALVGGLSFDVTDSLSVTCTSDSRIGPFSSHFPRTESDVIYPGGSIVSVAGRRGIILNNFYFRKIFIKGLM